MGLTLAVNVGQALVAPGDGTVDQVIPVGARWRNDIGLMRAMSVRIDHGFGIKTYIHGLQAAARYGTVTRGQQLGTASHSQIFFAVELDGKLVDPSSLSSYFGLLDGFLVYGKANNLRQAPDLVTTLVSLIQSLIYQGVRYFIPPVPVPVLFNLDFNGAGDKSGAAVVGDYSDVWNVVAAIDFSPLAYGYGYYGVCYGGVTFPATQGFFLNDYRGTATKVYFERGLLTAAAGTTAFFDPMLSSWVGGYTGITPRLNSFTIRNLPAGTYDLYLYSNGGTTTDVTTFYCAVDGGIPTSKVATPTVATDWVEDENYVKFGSLVVAQKGSVTVSAYGYLAGLQLQRQ